MGIPYQGNKTKIANQLTLFLRHSFPDCTDFYDLFGGGGSITEAAHKHYKRVVYNELNESIYLAVSSIWDGSFKVELPKSEFITREEFFEIKEAKHSARRGLVLSCWSFGNNLDDYIYGEDIEDWKQALHNLIFTDSVEVAMESLDIMERRVFKKGGVYTLKFDRDLVFQLLNTPKMERRFLIRNLVCDRQSLERLQRLERLQSLERLQRLQRLQSLQSLERHNLSYSGVPISGNCILYCDIPYNTKSSKGAYNTDFDHEAFHQWAKGNKNCVVFSEYAENVPEGMKTIWSKHKRNTISATSNILSTEVLVWNGVGNFYKTQLF